MRIIDLRSDTVTKPSAAMREAMISAPVGDDVYGDDPTVNALQDYAAQLLGFETALFTCSGTQANFIALLAHCQRGDEYIVGQQAHTYRYEGGGAAVFGSIQPQPIEFAEDGTLDLEQVAEKIKPDDYHFASTRLLCLENTQNGRALPLDYFFRAATLCQEKGLNLHLDGARLFNASVFSEIDAREITKHFDSVSVCLSKGLGAPVGSVLCGSSSFITRARRWRKVAGGGMRQAGMLAAAGLFALENNIDRLADDHAHARLLAEGLKKIPRLRVHFSPSQTNMVFIDLPEQDLDSLHNLFRKQGVIISWARQIRLVTHLDITLEDIEKVIKLFGDYFR